MNYLEERKKRRWSLEQVREKIGDWSVAAINGLEKHDKGGFELRQKLTELYGIGNQSAAVMHEVAAPLDQKKTLDKLRRQVQNIQTQIDAINETLKELNP